MEHELHPDGSLDGSLAGRRTALAGLLLAAFSLVICALITEAGLRASVDRAALPAEVPERAATPGVRAWLAGHSVLYQAVRQRVADLADRVSTAG
jgi:hypothetical protein